MLLFANLAQSSQPGAPSDQLWHEPPSVLSQRSPRCGEDLGSGSYYYKGLNKFLYYFEGSLFIYIIVGPQTLV